DVGRARGDGHGLEVAAQAEAEVDEHLEAVRDAVGGAELDPDRGGAGADRLVGLAAELGVVRKDRAVADAELRVEPDLALVLVGDGRASSGLGVGGARGRGASDNGGEGGEDQGRAHASPYHAGLTRRAALGGGAAAAGLLLGGRAHAIGPAAQFRIGELGFAGGAGLRSSGLARLGTEIALRTSIDVGRENPTSAALGSEKLFETPFLYL